MPDEIDNDLLTTWGRAFAGAIRELDLEVCGQDATEVWQAALGDLPSRARLGALTEDDILRLRDAARAWLEDERIETFHLALAIKETLWHWGGLN